jgi:hypothetical protein
MLSLTIKNKWSMGWMRSWFYCRVPCHCSFEGGKSVHILHSRMSALDCMVDSKVKCSDDDPNDAAFIRVTTTIEDRDTVEEFMACKVFPLASGFGFKDVPVGMTLVSKARTSLPLFTIESVSTEDASRVLVEVETEAERFLGNFRPREYDEVMATKLPNGAILIMFLSK